MGVPRSGHARRPAPPRSALRPSPDRRLHSRRIAHRVSDLQGTENAKADAVRQIVRDTMGEQHLKAVIVRVSVDGKDVLTEAFGESMTGVPASTKMHFRNGAVAISYMSTLLLQLVDEKKVSLDDKVSKWLPNVPNSDQVTLGQLAQMTSGYADYVSTTPRSSPPSTRSVPNIHTEELSSAHQSLLYEPGTNWNYSHTDYVILGLALEKITRTKMTTLCATRCSAPSA